MQKMLKVLLFSLPLTLSLSPLVGCGGREQTTVIEQPVKSEAELQREMEEYDKQMSSDS